MAIFTISKEVTVPATGTKEALSMIGSAAIIARLRRIVIAFASAPLDEQFAAIIYRTTSAVTGGGSLTPEPHNGISTSACSCKEGESAAITALTKGNRVLTLAQAQRGIYQWVATPDEDIWVALATNAGLLLEFGVASAGSTPIASCMMSWDEEP